MNRRLIAGWALVALLATVPTWLESEPPPRTGVAERLFGPITSLAASLQWVRVDVALRAGRPEIAYARAERALLLDPGSPDGWLFLGRHFLLDRGSLESEPDPDRRQRWIESGIHTLERGSELARDPAQLHLARGLAFTYLGTIDEADLTWPGGRTAAWTEAVTSFERAHELGHSEAEALLLLAREQLDGQ